MEHSRDIPLDQMKAASKHNQATINDYIATVLSQTAHHYLKEHEEEQRRMTIFIPVNLHSSNPMKVEEVELKNGLTVSTFQMPLQEEDFKKGIH